MDTRKLLAGAISGFVSAALVDLNAWAKADKAEPGTKFDLNLAAKRWLTGALSGAMTAAGLEGLS